MPNYNLRTDRLPVSGHAKALKAPGRERRLPRPEHLQSAACASDVESIWSQIKCHKAFSHTRRQKMKTFQCVVKISRLIRENIGPSARIFKPIKFFILVILTGLTSDQLIMVNITFIDVFGLNLFPASQGLKIKSPKIMPGSTSCSRLIIYSYGAFSRIKQ